MIGRNLNLILYCGADKNWIECQAYLLQKKLGPAPSVYVNMNNLVRSKRNLDEDFNKIGQTIDCSKFVKVKNFKFKKR